MDVSFETFKLFELTDPNNPHYSIVMGPTSIDDSTEWWKNDSLKTTRENAWIKYPDLALNTACELISVIVNLLILSSTIKMEKQTNGELKIIVNKSIKIFETIRINSSTLAQFNGTSLLQKFNALFQFIKIKLNSAPSQVYNSTIQNLELISQFLIESMG